jgi:hypothetical protein
MEGGSGTWALNAELTQATIQLSILFKHSIGSSLKIVIAMGG